MVGIGQETDAVEVSFAQPSPDGSCFFKAPQAICVLGNSA